MQKFNKSKSSIVRPFKSFKPLDLSLGGSSKWLEKIKKDIAEGKVNQKPLPPIEDAIAEILAEDETDIYTIEESSLNLENAVQESYSNPNLRVC